MFCKAFCTEYLSKSLSFYHRSHRIFLNFFVRRLFNYLQNNTPSSFRLFTTNLVFHKTILNLTNFFYLFTWKLIIFARVAFGIIGTIIFQTKPRLKFLPKITNILGLFFKIVLMEDKCSTGDER